MKKNMSFLIALALIAVVMGVKSAVANYKKAPETTKIDKTNLIMNSEMETNNILNQDYVVVMHHEDGSVAVIFNIEDDKVFALGEEMNAVREEAYMNGYNWDAFLKYYLAENAPDILEGMDTDPEAGSYVAYYDDGTENEAKAKRLAAIIVSLVEQKEKVFQILRNCGDEIEWD